MVLNISYSVLHLKYIRYYKGVFLYVFIDYQVVMLMGVYWVCTHEYT